MARQEILRLNAKFSERTQGKAKKYRSEGKLLKKSKFVINEMDMETTSIRQKLHQFIDAIEDTKAEAIYTLFEDEIDTGVKRRKLIQAERENYLRGEGHSYSWEDIKDIAVHKEKRHVLKKRSSPFRCL